MLMMLWASLAHAAAVLIPASFPAGTRESLLNATLQTLNTECRRRLKRLPTSGVSVDNATPGRPFAL